MENLRNLAQLLAGPIPDEDGRLFNTFITAPEQQDVLRQLLQTQEIFMKNWKLFSRINQIMEQNISIPNAREKQPYEAVIDFGALGWNDVSFFVLEGLEDTGLHYDATTSQISGTPVLSGDRRLTIRFNITGEKEGTPPHEKPFTFIINPDPKSLWKNIPSDPEASFAKADEAAEFAPLGDRHIVVSSKRGRSHANQGSFRDDDFAFRYFADTGWSVVAVSDGAGSATFAREGSRLACATVIDYFATHLPLEHFASFDELIQRHIDKPGEETQRLLNHFVYNNLGQAALAVHKKLEESAAVNNAALRDFHATLIFTLFKKYDAGYAILSFGVGDCPIALLGTDIAEVTLMNKMDVGEYGGGTRFITMQEIFRDKFADRFGFRFVPDFSYLILMTDGIYDPKFGVEANLEKADQWKAFLDDLAGQNEAGVAVRLKPDNTAITTELAAWMDFWSQGNHDDRTLAIIF